MEPTTVDKATRKKEKLSGMIAQIDAIIEQAVLNEKKHEQALANVHPNYKKSACNLLHYRALRSKDLRKLQKKLQRMGLSRFAKSHSHVMASLQTNRAILAGMLEEKPLDIPTNELSFKKGTTALRTNAKKLLGYRTKGRRTRIMVTMPSDAADNYEMVRDMITSGMNCARINCAHDDATTWKKMIDNIRKASIELNNNCKVAMDLAGPKIRTGDVVEGPRVLKIRPTKDIYGKISEPLPVWIGPTPKIGFLHIPVSEEDLKNLTGKKILFFTDTRNKNRRINLTKKEIDGFLAHCGKTTFVETGMPLFFSKNKTGPCVRVGELPHKEIPITLNIGDWLRLDKEPLLGEPAVINKEGQLVSKAHISCTAPAIFDQVEIGERILFDDGKIEGVIKKITNESLMIKITHAVGGVAKLRAEKGINFPDTKLTISGLTEKDKTDLVFVAEHADVVNYSFVNQPEDVRELLAELEKLNAKDKLGIVLKIETKNGYNKLTQILLEAMHIFPVGVMIARGDLAIETGWDNIGWVQEEILSLCQAAHITDIWATQVLENLAKRGLPSRSEITDAVMAQRADCVMLNKGPFILQAIQLMDIILKDMEPYRDKNLSTMPRMQKTAIQASDKHS
ncbi:MAG: pyruvate kinase [Bacteroidota bacterium]